MDDKSNDLKVDRNRSETLRGETLSARPAADAAVVLNDQRTLIAVTFRKR
jgi:hypothetical protein